MPTAVVRAEGNRASVGSGAGKFERPRAGELVIRPFPTAYARYAIITLVVMTLLNLVSIVAYHTRDDDFSMRVASLFMFDKEANLATLYAFSLIVINAVFLALLAGIAWQSGSRWRWHWAGLSAVFVVLAYDEASTLHEKLNIIAKQLVIQEGALYFPWVILGGAFLGAFGLLYLRFVLALPRITMILFFAGGALFAAGALGVEMLGAAYAFEHGGVHTTIGYELIATVEELAEKSGMIVFGYALLRLMAMANARIGITLDAASLAREGSTRS